MVANVAVLLGLSVNIFLSSKAEKYQGEYCHRELFQPRCQKNEVILITSAILGRMRIGRCLKAEEMNEMNGPRHFGCSTDVLSILDERCSGKTECEVRVIDILSEDNSPCFPGLNLYLDISHVCISTVDESRSCAVAATTIPVHIIVSQKSPKICGTRTQPWTVETSIGKKIKITLIELNAPSSDQNQEQHRKQCYGNDQGVIIDRTEKRNISICRDYDKREISLYSSSGNSVNIISNDLPQSGADNAKRTFLIKLEAIGCSDIVPPEDTWLRRNDDVISIGCYSSRQTWRLNCQNGKWVGALGNCTFETSLSIEPEASEQKATLSKDEQVLAIVAIVGCTLAICMAIVCTGAVCLRRFYVQSKRDKTYKTLSCNYDYNGDNSTGLRLHSQMPANVSGNDIRCSNESQIPTYSVYVGDGPGHDQISVKQHA